MIAPSATSTKPSKSSPISPTRSAIAATHCEQGELDRAIRDFDQAIKIKPDFAEALINRGNAFAGKGEFDTAIRDYDQVIKIKPDFANAFCNRGIAFAKKGELDTAIRDFDQALKIKPDYVDAHDGRAIVLAHIHAQETEKK